jgi:hypothetical protein
VHCAQEPIRGACDQCRRLGGRYDGKRGIEQFPNRCVGEMALGCRQAVALALRLLRVFVSGRGSCSDQKIRHEL